MIRRFDLACGYSLKKNIHRKEIVTEITQSEYQQSFQDIALQISESKTIDDWKDV